MLDARLSVLGSVCVLFATAGMLVGFVEYSSSSPLSDAQMECVTGLNGNQLDNGSANCDNVNTGVLLVTQASCNLTRLPPPRLQCVKCADVQSTRVTGGNGGKLNQGNFYNCTGAESLAPCVAGAGGFGVCQNPWVVAGVCAGGFTIYTAQ
jgi:hypothetical protein